VRKFLKKNYSGLVNPRVKYICVTQSRGKCTVFGRAKPANCVSPKINNRSITTQAPTSSMPYIPPFILAQAALAA
jgi:hypothetical protein